MPDPRLARPEWRGRTNMDALTISVVEHAEAIKRERWPDRPELHHEYIITQGSYQAGAGDPNSAGVHDLGGGGDARWCGHPECIWALRAAGAFASHRTPQQGPWVDHIHFVVVGHPFLAAIAQRQIDAYFAGRNGLANNGPDDGPRINPIPRPVWPWPPIEEDDMFTDSDRAMLTKLLQKAENSGARERRTNELLRKIRKDVAGLPADVVVEIDTALLQD